nr:MAG TPA: hypothetical protein [Caudoviricetes sp.]
MSFLPPGLPFAAFSATPLDLRPAPGRLPPRPPVLFDFVGTFLTAFPSDFAPGSYYPFDFAVFLRVTPGRCPL